jgi:hypothetical protein
LRGDDACQSLNVAGVLPIISKRVHVVFPLSCRCVVLLLGTSCAAVLSCIEIDASSRVEVACRVSVSSTVVVDLLSGRVDAECAVFIVALSRQDRGS